MPWMVATHRVAGRGGAGRGGWDGAGQGCTGPIKAHIPHTTWRTQSRGTLSEPLRSEVAEEEEERRGHAWPQATRAWLDGERPDLPHEVADVHHVHLAEVSEVVLPNEVLRRPPHPLDVEVPVRVRDGVDLPSEIDRWGFTWRSVRVRCQTDVKARQLVVAKQPS